MSNAVAGWPQFQSASDRSLLIRFADRISLDAHEQVTKLVRLLQAEPIAGIRNLHPAYCSVLVTFDALAWNPNDLESTLREYLARVEDSPAPDPRLVEIPACYGGSFGPDLDELAALHGISPMRAIELHASATYVVYFLGFAPGFAYLGGLPESLATPRLATPRRSVAAGSIGIAGEQTAVYPFATPGGWRLMGRTPLAMFRPDRKDMCLLSIGDHVRFRPISPEQFVAMSQNGKTQS